MSKIIVVDDDSTNAELIRLLLELDGFSVTPCMDIAQAETAASPETDAFVIDINLSRGTSGLDLLRDIRQGKTNANSEAIVIMTSGDHRRQNESMQNGASYFLLKPYPPEELSAILNRLLNGEGSSG